MTQRITVRPLVAGIIIVSTAALLIADWLLLRKNDQLEAAFRARASSLAPRVGTRVPNLQGLTLEGRPISIGYAGETRQTLLFVFSTRCSLCDANWPYWESVARQIDPNQFRLVYANISDSMPDSYTRTHYFHPNATVLARVDPQSSVDYSLSLTPILLAIGADGTVRSVWLGITKDTSRREMESALGVTLDAVTLALWGPGE